MAIGTIRVDVDVTPLVEVACYDGSCRFHIPETNRCNLKKINICGVEFAGSSGHCCGSFEARATRPCRAGSG